MTPLGPRSPDPLDTDCRRLSAGNQSQARAGNRAPPRRTFTRYPLPTYEEDWRALSDGAIAPTSGTRSSSCRSPPMAQPPLSLGGELRVTYERFGNRASD